MKQSLFISYSRQQTPFVDRFVNHFEDQGYPICQQYEGPADISGIYVIIRKQNMIYYRGYK